MSDNEYKVILGLTYKLGLTDVMTIRGFACALRASQCCFKK